MENLFSCLYAGPLSASAQRIVTALRAEYADRLDRSHSYLQRRPVNPFQSQSTWSQTQNNHSSSSRSWPRPYSSFTGTQGESQTPRCSAPERDSSPSHATSLPAWMESAEREPVLPSFTLERESPLSPLPFHSSQTEFSLRLDSPQYEPSFHFQPVKRYSGFLHSPKKDRPFPLPSPQRGSPFSSVFPPKEPPLTPPSMDTDLQGFTRPAAAPIGAVRRLRMPHQQDRAEHLQSQAENRSDQARQPMILETHARLESHQSGLHMHHTRPETNQTGPHIHLMRPENHCKETRPWARPGTHTRLDNHQVDPDFCHTKCDISQAGPDDLHTKPASHKTQASSEAFRAGSEFSDLQKGVEDKDDPPATSPVITVPQIPSGRSRREGWVLSMMPSREASERGEQTENVPLPADPAKKWEFGRLLVPAHRSPMNTAEIVSSQFDRQSAGPMREESREMEVDLGHSSDRVVAQEDVTPLVEARDERETMTPSKRGCDLGSMSEKSLIQVPVPCSRSSSAEETHGGHENTSAQAHDHPTHLLDTQMEAETEPNPDSQLPSLPSGSDSAEAPSAFEHVEHAHALSSSDMPRHGNQHESEADDRCDRGNQSNHGEHNDQGNEYEENAWFDRETGMTEPNTQQALTHTDIPTAEESHPEQKRQKISLTEGGTGKQPKKFPEVERFTESRTVDTARSEGRGLQRRLGVSSRALGFRAPPAVRTPLHPSQPSPQVVSGSSSGLSPNRISGPPKRHLMTPIAKGLVESPRIASSLSPTPRAHPTPLSERTLSTPSQQLSLSRRPVRWEPPRSSQGSREETDDFSHQIETTLRSCPRPQASASVAPKTSATEPHPTAHPRSETPHPHLPPVPQRPPPLGSYQQSPAPGEPPVGVKDESSGPHGRRKRPRSITREPPISHQPAPRATNQKQAGAGPERRQPGVTGKAREEAGMATTKPKPNPLTSDPRVCDAGQLSAREREGVLGEVKMARALVLTLVFQDGSTQLDLEQKNSPSVCGILILLKRALDLSRPQQTEEEKLLFLRLEQRPAWVQQQPDQSHEQFTRELVLLVLSGHRQVVCYKAKDLLRTTLQHHTQMLNWKQMGVCEVLDPQIAAWLLDPADSATCFQELLSKHSKTNTHSSSSSSNTHSFTLALGPQKVTQLISGLNQLYKLMVELRSALQTKGLWQLYSQMEIQMIPVLAAMESHRIHVDRDALKKTSEMLGSKLKQLEQEAHQAAGQQFLVSSNNQLRLVLFEKLRLHERCENKKLPKTLLKQQQSTSEAVLLQLQDLHPLPKIILAYRQVHKIKSAFVDGILSCVNKMFISSTWNQTSAVSGRLSAKHPNFQALPKQPIQITKTQYVHGKEAELVTVHPRTMFIPRQGWTFLSADFCQMELRLLAHLSSDPELLRIFQNPDADVFSMLASQWKGIKEDSVSSEDREHAKRVVYSVVYGAGRERLSGILGVSAEQASHFQDSFLQTYREVQTFIQRTIQQCQNQGYVVSIMGRRRSLPHIHSADWGARNQAERQAVNFVVQGSAADLCKMAMIRIFSQVTCSASLTARLVAQIHDELLFEVEEQQLQEFALLVKSTMESLQHIDNLGVNLTVPLKVVVSSGSSWGSMSELCLPPSSPSA